MERELKFRAWRESTNEMIFSDNKENGGWLNVFFQEIEELGSEYKLMQFTGLKDKNGKEVYEGDIIRKTPDEWTSNTDDSISMEEYFKSISQIGIVEYTVCGFHLTNKFYQDEIYPRTQHGSIEVIGNIYENPELIPQ